MRQGEKEIGGERNRGRKREIEGERERERGRGKEREKEGDGEGGGGERERMWTLLYADENDVCIMCMYWFTVLLKSFSPSLISILLFFRV